VFALIGAFADVPSIPQQFIANTERMRVEQGAIVQKTESDVYYDAPNVRLRVETTDELYDEERIEIYRGDLGLDAFIKENEDYSCIVVQAPDQMPYVLNLPDTLVHSGDDVIHQIDVAVWSCASCLPVTTYYLNKDNNYPVRVVLGDSDSYEQVDFNEFTPLVELNDTYFDLPSKCQNATLPGSKKMMTRHELHKYFAVKPTMNLRKEPSLFVEMKKLNLTHGSALSKRVDPSQIIAVGTQLWQIVKDNAPTTSVNTLSNGAIPANTQWTEFAGWGGASYGPWGWGWTNGLGAQVVDFEWSFDWNCKGNWQGTGQYIQNAGAFPRKINVGWGYNVAVDGQILQPTNLGSVQSPLAGIQIYTTMKISTALSTNTQACKMQVQGDCNAVKIFCDQY
jgi:hypothetical protein